MRAAINLNLGDSIKAMRKMHDKAYSLAIVDPVYGDLVTRGGYMSNSSSKIAKNKNYNDSLWKQRKTSKEYFKELFRVSHNQIVWGGNYFTEEISQNKSCWVVWDKDNGENHFADCELAWTSFDTAVRKFKWKWQGMLQQNMKNKQMRIHPTEKPIELYKWLLSTYAKPGDRILDTHGGSMSIAIACWDMGYDLDLWEIDPDYYEAGKKRFEIHKKQLQLF